MLATVNSIQIVKRVEDLLEQCAKVEKSKIIQSCIQLLSLINEESHPKAKDFYKTKIIQYWETIKQDILTTPLKLSNALFVIENPLQIDFGKILNVADDNQKEILALHFKSVAAAIWPNEFETFSSDNREEELIDSLFDSLISIEHLQDPTKTPASIIQNLTSNKPLLDKTKNFADALTQGNLDPQKVLNQILRKVTALQELMGSDENIEELKTIIEQTKDKPFDFSSVLMLIYRLKQSGVLKYFAEHRLLEHVPEQAKNIPGYANVLKLLSQECPEEN